MRIAFLLVLVVCCVRVQAAEPPLPEKIEFNRDVRPILSDNCFFCHGNDPHQRKADLRLDLRDDAVAKQAITPGKPDASSLVARILSTDKDELMPPPASRKQLTPRQKEILKQWVAEGAGYEKHWSFEPPRRAALPMVKTPSWVRNPIDAFVLAELERAGLQPAPEADRRTLARRLSLDLTGLPPTPAEVEAFVNDKSPEAYESLVARWMKTSQWGEHRGRYWLDAARYGDTHGIHHDAYREIWPYRDWVIAAFNRNQRFDEFTVEQIAGDLLPNPTREQLIATGFHRCNITTAEGGTIADENLAMYANDRVTTTSWVWLGLTANCAACHDHKFDPITQRDFYSMAAYFRNTTQGAMDGNVKDTKPVIYLPPAADEKRFTELPKLIADATTALTARRREALKAADAWASSVKPSELGITAKPLAETEQKQLDNSRAFSVAARIKASASLKDGTLATGGDGWELVVQGKKFALRVASPDGKTNSLVISRRDILAPGKTQHLLATHDPKRGLRLYVDGLETESDRKEKQPPAKGAADGIDVQDVRVYAVAITKGDARSLSDEPALLTALGVEPAKRAATQKNSLIDFYFRSVDEPARELAVQIDELTNEETAIRGRSIVTHVQEEKPGEAMANVLMRGAYDKVGEKVTPASFSSLHAMPTDAPKNRLGLARWLVADENPLMARVTVNRFWQELFGTGLVRTAEDFGSQGERPVNQALLDWLAVEFRESGWDVKKLFTLMVTSATYRQASLTTPEKLARDPQNRLLSRGPRFRMDAEMIRDYALAVSGSLSLKMGGPGTKPYQPSNIWEVVGLHGARYTQDHGENLYRRTIYNFWKRQSPSPNMEVFNAPTREVCTVRRERTNTPLQALVTLNDPQFVEAARRLAEAVLKEHADSTGAIDTIARRVLLRPLGSDETKIVAQTATALEAEFTTHPERAQALLKVGESKVDETLPAPRLASLTMVASQLLNLDEALNK
ncbi:MAG: DUF1553 domain-containing protein [Planctomycetaceae bacterium]|nr:DUF1553 domain-containing protein [Planctomycetaceae bacterium]